MQSELQIAFRNMKASAEAEDWIRAEVAELESLYGQLVGCRVVVEVPHRHHKKGSRYHVRIDIAVPRGTIIVKRQPGSSARARQLDAVEIKKQEEANTPHKDLRLAISDAFKAAGRRLQDYARRQRGAVKTHEELPEARVSRILPEEDHGFLTSSDGREIYFHKNSVLGGAFPRLKVGTVVRYVEESGDEGPQASTVRVAAKQGIRQTTKAKAAAQGSASA